MQNTNASVVGLYAGSVTVDAGHRAARLKRVAARTVNRAILILGVNLGLHCQLRVIPDPQLAQRTPERGATESVERRPRERDVLREPGTADLRVL